MKQDGKGELTRRPQMRFENALFFYNKTGFSDQPHHSSALLFLSSPSETYSREMEREVCVPVCMCFTNVCFLFCLFPLTKKQGKSTLKQTLPPIQSSKLLYSNRLHIKKLYTKV